MAKTKTKHIANKQEKIEIKYTEQKRYETKELISIFGVATAFVLIIVGLFTAMIKANGTYLSPITYFIKNGIEEITKASAGIGKGVAVTHYLLVLLTWLLAFGSTTGLLAFWIIKMIHFFRDSHSNFDYRKTNRWMCGFITPYILIVCSTLLGTFPNNITCKIGFGIIFIFFGVIAILAIDSINSIDMIRSSLGVFIVDRIVYIFLLTIPFWYGSVFSIYKGDDLQYSLSPFCLVAQILNSGVQLTGNPAAFISAVFFANVSIIFIPLIARAIHNQTKIIFTSIDLVILTVGFICMQIYGKSTQENSVYIETPYYLLYLGILAVLFLVVALVIQNRQPKEKKN